MKASSGHGRTLGILGGVSFLLLAGYLGLLVQRCLSSPTMWRVTFFLPKNDHKVVPYCLKQALNQFGPAR